MALTQEDLAALAQFIDNKLDARETARASRPQTPAERAAVVGTPDVDPQAGPDYWVHLADGSVLVSKDSQSTHMESNGETCLVIGRYLKAEEGQ